MQVRMYVCMHIHSRTFVWMCTKCTFLCMRASIFGYAHMVGHAWTHLIAYMYWGTYRLKFDTGDVKTKHLILAPIPAETTKRLPARWSLTSWSVLLFLCICLCTSATSRDGCIWWSYCVPLALKFGYAYAKYTSFDIKQTTRTHTCVFKYTCICTCIFIHTYSYIHMNT